jgi:hypothetical protein
MNPQLEIALNQYTSVWGAPTILMSLGIFLLVLALAAFVAGKNPMHGWMICAGGLLIILGVTVGLPGVLSFNQRFQEAESVKTILSAPAWEVRDAVLTGNAVTSFELTTLTNPREVTVLGKTVEATPTRVNLTVRGELLEILLGNRQLAQAIQNQTTIAQAK